MDRSKMRVFCDALARMSGSLYATEAREALASQRLAEEVRARIRAEAGPAGARQVISGTASDAGRYKSGHYCGCRAALEEKDAEVARLKRNLKYHDNPHSLPSQRPLYGLKAAAARKKKAPGTRTRRPTGAAGPRDTRAPRTAERQT